MPTQHVHEKPPLPHPTSDTELIQLYRKIIRILKELDAAHVELDARPEPADVTDPTTPARPTASTTPRREPDVAT